MGDLEAHELSRKTRGEVEKITSSTIRQGMLSRFSDPEWAIMWEVGEGTGAGPSRYADAVMMSLWPSRGLELHGVEIKVTRSDWKREAADPKKAEAIGKYCDRWWVHTAPGVVDDLSDVPPAWGLREYDGKAWKTLREASLNPDPIPTNRRFLAALLRRADGGMRADAINAARNAVQAERDAIRQAVEKQVAQEIERRTGRHEALAGQVKAFEEASGLLISSGGLYGGSHDAEEIGRAVALVQKLGLVSTYGGVSALRTNMERLMASIDALTPSNGARLAGQNDGEQDDK